jgi:hypothetical protein
MSSVESVSLQPGRLVLVVAVVAAAMGGAAGPAAGQRVSWDVAVGSAYNDNVFRLAPSQKEALGGGDERYADMNAAYDVASTVRLRSSLRTRGLAGRRLDLGAEARAEYYVMSPRQSHGVVRVSAEQRLARRSSMHARVSLVPHEFRRNYLSGADGDGGALYAPGVVRRVSGEVGYERNLLRGRGRPRIDGSVDVTGSLRGYPDFPWRDRREVGIQVGTDAELGAVRLELSVGRGRAFHNGMAEPVLTDGAVTLMELHRDFDVTDLAVGTSLRVARGARVGLGFEHRARDYRASLAEDPVYGDREDRRNTFLAELRLRATRRVDVRVGGDIRHQSAFRPGRGDTGDEARYDRHTAFVRVEYTP